VEQSSAKISEVALTIVFPAKASDTARCENSKQTKEVPLKELSSEAESSEEDYDNSSAEPASMVSREDDTGESELPMTIPILRSNPRIPRK
jgi:hypothetical protein